MCVFRPSRPSSLLPVNSTSPTGSSTARRTERTESGAKSCPTTWTLSCATILSGSPLFSSPLSPDNFLLRFLCSFFKSEMRFGGIVLFCAFSMKKVRLHRGLRHYWGIKVRFSPLLLRISLILFNHLGARPTHQDYRTRCGPSYCWSVSVLAIKNPTTRVFSGGRECVGVVKGQKAFCLFVCFFFACVRLPLLRSSQKIKKQRTHHDPGSLSSY